MTCFILHSQRRYLTKRTLSVVRSVFGRIANYRVAQFDTNHIRRRSVECWHLYAGSLDFQLERN
jgi:hypothetical protein